MSISERKEAILDAVKAAHSPVRPSELMNLIASSRASLNRDLRSLAESGLLRIQGKGRSTSYLADADLNKHSETRMQWSSAATALLESLSASSTTRTKAQYEPSFLNDYTPNLCSLLPPQLALHLFHAGYRQQKRTDRLKGLAAKRCLNGLAWSSAHLDGLSMGQIDAIRVLSGRSHHEVSSRDTTVLLNHKDAVDHIRGIALAPDLSTESIVDVQALLMRDLVSDARLIGSIRSLPIYDCSYSPSHDSAVLQASLNSIADKARQVHNPIEAAFFLWVSLSYLQPFNFGNGCTARLAANIPLLQENCAPVSFLGIDRADYELALSGVYEKQDMTAAVELFEFAYRQSARRLHH